MNLPFETAKGTADQLLNVRSPIYMRVGLPGALAMAVLYPPAGWLLARLPSQPEYLWQRVVAAIALAFLLGGIVSLLSDEIYKIYEGRILWPVWLLREAKSRQEARLGRLKRQEAEARAAGDVARLGEIWLQLRAYPVDDNSQPEVRRPTLLGNILEGYEQYPDTRYGMDSVFYWPRIWMLVEKDKKEEIDGRWCLADGFLTFSAVSLIGGAVWMVAAFANAAGVERRSPVS